MTSKQFDADSCLKHLQHYLPAQAPLKDFVHHNTLHAFQSKPFFEALQQSHAIFGYKTALSLNEYRALYHNGKIAEDVLDWVIANATSETALTDRKNLMLNFPQTVDYSRKIGELRKFWKKGLKLDLNTIVHLNLFKLVGTYLDQGISANPFPAQKKGLLSSIQSLEQNTFFEFFHSKRVKELLFKKNKTITDLLVILVGDEKYFEQYLFDQQFAHPGWSGIVNVIEKNPQTLLARKHITFADFVYLELLLEIDALDGIYGAGKWPSIGELTTEPPCDIFQNELTTKEWEIKSWWQEAYEFSFYDQVLCGLKGTTASQSVKTEIPSFQAFFCIDDREESIRRQIELVDPRCETFGTPAHFNLPIFYRPAGGKFNTQVCPGSIQPEHIIVDDRTSEKNRRDLHFHQTSHGLFGGWIIAQTLGFWSAMKLFVNIFKPTISPAHSSSFEHMSHKSNLIIENVNGDKLNGLKIGFTHDEMCTIVSQELKKAGLIDGFAPLVYLFGHGGSSTNNPYYAGYNCGACSGRPSSLNARVFAAMVNKPAIRNFLNSTGFSIPDETQFIGGLHDTTRDEFVFYDTQNLSARNAELHSVNLVTLNKGLANNAKERARQFSSISLNQSTAKIHTAVKNRSVSLFEPRPELNHSNNCLCIVGTRAITKNLFLDQRSFLNSYDWSLDPTGELLTPILNAATPVCGGINLEYYFSRIDNENFGAGSKLPHNVVGLFGVANGIEGDLRTGLPIQMVEVHDPLRLMMIIEQKPAVVLDVINRNANTKQWYENGWVNLAIIDPETKEIFVYRGKKLCLYTPLKPGLETVKDLNPIFAVTSENLPIFNLN